MCNSCYWFINHAWLVCFAKVSSSTAPKIFGFAEFISSLALLVIVYTISDIRYKFRTSVAPLPIAKITFVIIGLVGLGTLITEIWLAQNWCVIKTGLMTRAIWQGLTAIAFLSAFMMWIWFAFIQPPIFGKLTAKKFLKEIYRALLKGNESELNIIADELSSSAGQIVKSSMTISERRSEKFKKDSLKGLSYEALFLISDKRFCQSVSKSCPGTAIELFREVVEQNKYDIPIGGFVVNLSTVALSNKDSLLYHESFDSHSSLVARIKPLSQALYGNYCLIQQLGRYHQSPLDIDYRTRNNWDAENWKAYSRAICISIRAYLENTKGQSFSSEIYRAIDNLKQSFFDTYKLNGNEEFYYSEPYQKFDVAINFLRDFLKILEDSESLYFSFKKEKLSLRDDIYDVAAKFMFDLILAASKIKSPQWVAWDIHYCSVWARFFSTFEDSKALRVFQHKVRRLIYDEIKTIDEFPNYQNIRVLGYALNVMGLKEKNQSNNRAYLALHKIVLKWTKANFDKLCASYPDVADAALIGSISYKPKSKRLIKTYRKGIGQKKAPREILQL